MLSSVTIGQSPQPRIEGLSSMSRPSLQTHQFAINRLVIIGKIESIHQVSLDVSVQSRYVDDLALHDDLARLEKIHSEDAGVFAEVLKKGDERRVIYCLGTVKRLQIAETWELRKVFGHQQSGGDDLLDVRFVLVRIGLEKPCDQFFVSFFNYFEVVVSGKLILEIGKVGVDDRIRKGSTEEDGKEIGKSSAWKKGGVLDIPG